jgi:hypothetical protein
MRGLQHPSSWPGESRSSWRDVAVVVCVTVLATIVSAHYNPNEMLYALTRHGERFQIDELPIGMGALLICLVWLAWRRYRQAEGELRARSSPRFISHASCKTTARWRARIWSFAIETALGAGMRIETRMPLRERSDGDE